MRRLGTGGTWLEEMRAQDAVIARTSLTSNKVNALSFTMTVGTFGGLAAGLAGGSLMAKNTRQLGLWALGGMLGGSLLAFGGGLLARRNQATAGIGSAPPPVPAPEGMFEASAFGSANGG